jgi:hypothetical protein
VSLFSDFFHFFISNELVIFCLWLICFRWVRLCNLRILVILIEFMGMSLELSDTLLFYGKKSLDINKELDGSEFVWMGSA